MILEITRFELTHFFGIDLGHLIDSNKMAFNLQRGIPCWLTDLKLRFDKTENYGFKRPIFDESSSSTFG